jgi:hypothetical protein
VREAGFSIVLDGYSKSDLDQVTLYYYPHGGQFAQAIDSARNPGLFMDSASSDLLASINYDYQLTFLTDTFFISNLQDEVTTFTSCTGAMPKMGTCQLSDQCIVSGKNISRAGRTITIHK